MLPEADKNSVLYVGKTFVYSVFAIVALQTEGAAEICRHIAG